MDRKLITTPTEGQIALQDFLMDRVASIPDDVRDKLREFVRPGGSPVAATVQACELIYARSDELPPSLLMIGAEIAAMAAQYNFSDMGVNGRGMAIAAAIRDMPGVTPPPPPVAAEAPEPLAEFVKADPGDGDGLPSALPPPGAEAEPATPVEPATK